MSKSLFEIQNEYLQLAEILEESQGELTPEVEAALQINQADLETKVQGYIRIIALKRAEIHLAREEEERAAKHRKRSERAIERLEEALLQAAKTFGDINVGTYKVSTRKSESVEIASEFDIPGEFFLEKVSRIPNKPLIKAAIKAGEDVPGAEIKVNYNLVIK